MHAGEGTGPLQNVLPNIHKSGTQHTQRKRETRQADHRYQKPSVSGGGAAKRFGHHLDIQQITGGYREQRQRKRVPEKSAIIG